LQGVAGCCRVLQCVAVCCSVLQCVAALDMCSAPQVLHIALTDMCVGVLQGVAGCCRVLECAAVCCRVLQGVAVCCSVLQCVAVYCSFWRVQCTTGAGFAYPLPWQTCVLECVAVCCSVSQCVAVCCSSWLVQCTTGSRCAHPLPWPCHGLVRGFQSRYRSPCYGVASISRLLKIISLFCRISSLLLGSFAKETYNLKEPTSQSHPICYIWKSARFSIFNSNRCEIDFWNRDSIDYSACY